MKTPTTTPEILPIPPVKETPPTTQAAIASISQPWPYAAEPEPTMRMHSSQEPKPYRIPARMKAPTVTRNTEMPETAAASALPPTANRSLPKVVLFQMNQTITTAAMAHRIMVGNPPTLGMIMLGMVVSMAPKETPLVE